MKVRLTEAASVYAIRDSRGRIPTTGSDDRPAADLVEEAEEVVRDPVVPTFPSEVYSFIAHLISFRSVITMRVAILLLTTEANLDDIRKSLMVGKSSVFRALDEIRRDSFWRKILSRRI